MGYEVLGTGDDAEDDAGDDAAARGRRRGPAAGAGSTDPRPYDLGGDVGDADRAAPVGRTSHRGPGRLGPRLAVGGVALLVAVAVAHDHASRAPHDAATPPSPTSAPTPASATPSAAGTPATGVGPAGPAGRAIRVSVMHVRVAGPVDSQVATVRTALAAGALPVAYDVHAGPMSAAAGAPPGVVVEFDHALTAAQQMQAELALLNAGPTGYSIATLPGQAVGIAVPVAMGSPCVRGTGFNAVLAMPLAEVDRVDRLLTPAFTSFTTRPGRAVVTYTGPARPRAQLVAAGRVLARACGRAPTDVTYLRGPAIRDDAVAPP